MIHHLLDHMIRGIIQLLDINNVAKCDPSTKKYKKSEIKFMKSFKLE